MNWFLLNIGEILIDEIYIPIAQSCTWSLNNSGYIYGSGKYRHQTLHYIIAKLAGLNVSNQIDHKDLNKFNNLISNLRSATCSQNNANTRTPSNNTSGYKGVYWNKEKQKWMARIKVNYKTIFLGYFDDPKDAYAAYCEAAVQYFGEFARTEVKTHED